MRLSFGPLAGRQSLWLGTGLVVILLVAVSFFTARNMQREREHMLQGYIEHADAMVWALEAGTRVGMGMRGHRRYMQSMLEETAKQHGVLFLALVDEDEKVLAHSDFSKIGSSLDAMRSIEEHRLGSSKTWRIVRDQDNRQIFELSTLFTPLPGFEPRMWPEGMNCSDEQCAPPPPKPLHPGRGRAVVHVALDMSAMEASMAREMRNNVIISLLTLLIGVGAVLFLLRAEQHRRSRRQLQDARAFASEVVTSLPLGILTTDTDGTILLANARAEGMFGGQGLHGEPIRTLNGPDWKALLGELDDGSQIEDREYILDAFGGLPVSLSASRIVNDDGILLGYLFLFRDLREIRTLQEQLKRNERLSALGNMAAGVAHEIRNPLSSIKGFATYLAGKVQESDREAAQIMVQETDRLNRVVTELLEFARPTQMHRTAQDLNDITDRALRLIRVDAEAKHISIVFTPEKSLPRLLIDAERMTQALLNICLNGVQAMNNGGVLRVETRLVAPAKVLLQIADTGCGIPADKIDGIFNPYYTTKPSGTGLGLAIVHRIVEAHHAEIRVQSVVGQGSIFSMYFTVQEN